MRISMAMRHEAMASALVAAIGFLAIAGALVIEHGFGYVPCMLCLWQRWPYYLGVPLAALVAVVALQGKQPTLVRAELVLIAATFLVGAGLGVHHAGVEWGFWPGPAACGGGSVAPTNAGGLMAQMQATRIVPCDAAAFRILGLSLAGWNVLVCLGLAAIAAWGALGRPATR
jgi:disulfide bond formation protein DsbB